ncbi:PspA-associated protein PspAB [Prauserella muralis]|uniref:Uncharacterized protein n=1 Tax=Prauserella muralis TaxID=588067 RepID=A0A2V4B222_9PSEU|nr:hypothetical protein [Prauserella muralis]PXY28254.1 hypothetical protein BAY60_18210 [Prauserella muralis]TWE27423.1 hypothetical protein FHX69_0046 [Prauserella muralis]
MGFLDTLLGRTKPVKPNLDVLFAIPGAAYTLEAALGMTPTGAGAVCFKEAEGGAAARTRADIRALLDLDHTTGVTISEDEYGYTWITCEQSTVDLPALMTQLHAVNATLADAGFGPSLLCTIVGFAGTTGDERRLGLVYLFKRGTVYPFAPTGAQRRDTELEMRARAEIAGELPVEPELERWFPIWSAPVP